MPGPEPNAGPGFGEAGKRRNEYRGKGPTSFYGPCAEDRPFGAGGRGRTFVGKRFAAEGGEAANGRFAEAMSERQCRKSGMSMCKTIF